LMEARIKAQSVTELELLRAQAELQRHVQNMADADAMVAMARHTLWTLTGLEVADTVVFGTDNTHQDVALDVFESYIEASPMVQAALFDAKVASAYMNTVRTATLPSLNAQFTERFTNATGFIGKESLYMAGVNLTWRLDIAAPYGVKAASAGVQAARMGVEKARRAVQEQVFQDWQRLDAARVKVQASALQKEAAVKAAKMARERYAVGVATQVDVIQAERDMFASEVACIQSRAELATARYGVRLSAGLPWNWQGPSS
jgi:outer membrane protein TolC